MTISKIKEEEKEKQKLKVSQKNYTTTPQSTNEFHQVKKFIKKNYCIFYFNLFYE